MALNNKITLEWDGKEYSTKVDMALIEKLDDAVNLISLSQAMAKGAPQITKCTKFFYTLLEHCGAKVDYSDLYQSLSVESIQDVVKTVGEVIVLCFPQHKGKPPKKRRASPKNTG